MSVSGNAYARVEADVRITSFNIKEINGEVQSKYEEFTKDTVQTEIEFSENTSIIYTVEVTNYGSNDIGISSIEGYPENISMEVSGYEVGNKLCNSNNQCNTMSKTTFDLKFSLPENYPGAYGRYVSGNINLNKNTTLYVYVGEQPIGKEYNGGGNSFYDGSWGGGATDIRLDNTGVSDFNSLKSRIMVAAGGSGTFMCDADGGGSGGGGSSFVSGHTGCDAIAESSTESNIVHTGQSIHYSGYSFINTKIIDGKGYNWTTELGDYIGMPTHDGTGTMVGNTGGGYAKITLLEIN